MNLPTLALSLSLAAFGMDDGSQTSAGTIWTGIKDGRERLQSGVFRAHGRKIVEDATLGRIEGDVELFVAFDFHEGQFRFDRSEPTWVMRDPQIAPRDPRGSLSPLSKAGPLKQTRSDKVGPSEGKNAMENKEGLTKEVGLSGGKYVKSKAKSIVWQEATRSAMIAPADFPPPMSISPFDIRCLGLVTPASMPNEAEAFDVVLAALSKQAWRSEPQSEGHWLLAQDVQVRAGAIRIRIWIDSRHGYTPVRFELRGSPQGDRPDVPSTYVCETTWTRVRDVWVPKTFHSEDRQQSDSVKFYDLAIEWQSVNEMVPASFFEVEGLGLPKDVMIVDRRLSTPIVLKAMGSHDVERSSGRPMGRRTWGMSLIVASNVVVLLVSLDRKTARNWRTMLSWQ